MTPVIVKHRPSHAPLSLRAGETVEVGQRSDKWPVFLWCTTSTGQAWVPDVYITISANVGTMKRDYTSRELAVAPGDSVNILERCGGWAFCSFADLQGWIPERCLKPARE